jgi:hypothetical protein
MKLYHCRGDETGNGEDSGYENKVGIAKID